MGIYRNRRPCLTFLALGCLGAALLGLGACSSDEETGTEVSSSGIDYSRYDDWLMYQNYHIVGYFPEGHPLADQIPLIVDGYPEAILKDCNLLQIYPPRETLYVYFYTGIGQGKEWTGREVSFADGNHIHFWMPALLGPPLMEYLLPLWNDKEPRFEFLRKGLIALTDESNRDYHKVTLDRHEQGMFVPLSELSKDTVEYGLNLTTEMAEAASFVDFLLYNYRMPALEALYLAESPFDMVCRGMLNVKASDLEEEWLTFVREVVAGNTPEPKDVPWARPADSLDTSKQ